MANPTGAEVRNLYAALIQKLGPEGKPVRIAKRSLLCQVYWRATIQLSAHTLRNAGALEFCSLPPVCKGTSGTIKMAAPCSENMGTPLRSPVGTPGKVQDLINEGIVSEERSDGRFNKDTSILLEVNTSFEALDESNSSEATSKEAFFSRVETFSSLKWAGKPPELSPLICAQYGWSNIDCDMLKCSCCGAYLSASLQPALDFNKYKQRCLEIKEALRTSHEKFCFWPDSPCPEHFWTLLLLEPSSVISDFIERFQNLCHLELQLPSLKHDDLKSMDLTEETVSLLLHLIEDVLQGRENATPSLISDSLQVHISACILALCGWNSSHSPGSLPLSIIHCPRCMRKVGLWSFQQLESVDLDSSLGPPSISVSPAEGDRIPLGVMSPNRRMTRSRDLEQSPSFAATQVRSGGSSVSPESDTVRSRPVTRSMGQGDNQGVTSEIYSSPHRKAKRPRLCSTSSTDSSSKGCFDPLNQHRRWCPWLTVVQGVDRGSSEPKDGSSDQTSIAGWKGVLRELLYEEKSRTRLEADSSSVPEKSHKVFRIFRQWQK
ncbi:zinc finger C3HC-type protein 1 isoform X2 [Engystomops pustulosus]|uniref:zinc finger C3HC-type protein 1 isoform X2 n=1 Tax=Engystomops pustulosus TaxID=76066 RepID=UPI003AFA956D